MRINETKKKKERPRYAWLEPWYVSHSQKSRKHEWSWPLRPSNEQFRFADANRSPQLLNMTRKTDVASALSNTIVRRGKLELMMSYFIWGNILEKLMFRCQKPKENRWL